MADSTRKDRRRKMSTKNDDVIVRDEVDSTTTEKKDANAPKRRKNAVADDVGNGENAGVQSSANSGTREPEPVPPPCSPEVIELRQLLIASKQQQLNLEQQLVHASQLLLNQEQQTAKKEEMYQRACQAVREAELRAEQAEKLVDTKRPVFDNVKRSELEEKIANLTKQLEETKKEKKRADKKIADLTNQLVEERDGKYRAIEKNNKLKRKLAEYEKSQVQETTDEGAAGRTDIVLNNTAHPRNIFNLLNPTAKHAISIDLAVLKVRTAFEKCGVGAYVKLHKKNFLYDCVACGECVASNRLDSTAHFLSEEHIGKVRASQASVPKLAVDDWANVLENAEAAAKRG